MCRLIVTLSLLLTVTACMPPRPPNVSVPPVIVVPTISVLTVEVEPKTAIVRVTSVDGTQIKERPTRSDGYYIEEFTFGVYSVNALALGYESSTPFTMTFDRERHYVKITLTKTPTPLVPVLSIVGRDFQNTGVLYIPRWVSELSILTKTAEEQTLLLEEDMALGFDGIRVFAGALTWAGQTPASAQAALPKFLDLATLYGLAIEVTAVTDSGTGYDAKAHLLAVAEIVKGRTNVIVEIGNEIGHPTQDSRLTERVFRQWGAEILTPRGIVWAVGAMLETDETCPPDPWVQEDGSIRQRPDVCSGYGEEYPGKGGSYNTAHLNRGRDPWDQFRRVREIYGIVESGRISTINNEPIGCAEPGTAGQRLFDPAYFYLIGALDRAFAVGGVHHSQAGLLALPDGPVQKACALAYVAGHTDVESVLPGKGSYRNVRRDADSPIASAIFVDTPTSADGVVRAYSFISGNRGVTVLVGLRGNAQLEWANGWRIIRTVGSRVSEDGRSAVVLEIGR